MRLSMVVELLLILLLVAFAAYGRVIERDGKTEERSIGNASEDNLGISTLSLKQATDDVNRYCTCNENICNCCRDFHIPLVQLQGPGCASLQYIQGDNLAVQLSFGDNILTSTIVNGKNPKPVCVPLPGGFTKFCGRIYSIKRDAKNHFKACLGLELQSSTELEASLRVSCFRFGPDGLKLRPAEPLPVVETEVPEEDDDDDFFGLDSDEDEEDDDSEEDTPLANAVPDSSSAEEDEDEDEDEDVLGFGALLDIITGEDETATKRPKVTTPAPLLQFTIPILTKPTASPVSVNPNVGGDVVASTNSEEFSNADEESVDEAGDGSVDTDTTIKEATVTEPSNKIAKPDKAPTKIFAVSDTSTKKPSVTSSSINAIENEANKKRKPLRKPVKDGEEDEADDILGDSLDDDDDDDDDEDEEILSDDEDEDEKNSEEEEGEKNDEDEDEKAEIEDLDDDDDEEEDAVISALVYDDKEDGKKKGKKQDQSSEADDDDSDYGLGLTGLLARNRHSRNNRRSKEMRFPMIENSTLVVES
ncbi:mitotic apparatus protein p62 [Apis mellifera]|uniref:Mitotic apparatus protein p62 n=1 Tax=Apis mellifera TaxID=7460 RepID=A0A7M7LKK9_APIME|nr:mitotic apparatus protein p62 [Apis mellifera]|eukprot:XP_001121344.2 mitotic apparatus protein p62 [Apis mellifera]